MRDVSQFTAGIAVCGLGRLGTCLARALAGAGLPLSAVASASGVTAERVAAELGPSVQAVPLEELVEHAQSIFLTVPDAHVSAVSARLKARPEQRLIHCSGALPRQALETETEIENANVIAVHTAVFHPLQTFPPDAEPTRWRGIYIGIEASQPALDAELRALANRLGAHSLSLTGVDRAAYHACAVIASNYIVALHALAERIWTQAGVTGVDARSALLPLSQGALDALGQHVPAAALTGPLRRGDVSSIEAHLQALSGDAQAIAIYRTLARELLRLPLGLPAEIQTELARLVGDSRATAQR
jgi:predicted short-subunit dehydrogenase-like oxidoreductase (DUF2520 family)